MFNFYDVMTFDLHPTSICAGAQQIILFPLNHFRRSLHFGVTITALTHSQWSSLMHSLAATLSSACTETMTPNEIYGKHKSVILYFVWIGSFNLASSLRLNTCNRTILERVIANGNIMHTRHNSCTRSCQTCKTNVQHSTMYVSYSQWRVKV